MLRRFTGIFAGLALLAFAVAAHADTITYGPTFYGTYNAGAGGTFSYPQFNPALGTLTEVSLVVAGSSSGGTNSVTNTSESSGTANLSIGSNIDVTGPSSLVVLTQPQETANGVTVLSGNNYTINGTSSTDTESDTIFGGFGPYEGAGNVTYNFTSALNASVTTNFSYEDSAAGSQFNFAPTVTYTYTPTPAPEPSTFALMGAGIVGLIGYCWRRKHSA